MEQKLPIPAAVTKNDPLLRATIDSSMDFIQVFSAVRDDAGQIVDFIWIVNNKTSENAYGDVIGKRLLQLNPGVVKEGIFETFKNVVETGEPNQSIRHYTYEQFNGWYYQSAVKLGDGVATTTRDITTQKNAEDQIRNSQLLLQSTIDTSLDIIQVFTAVRNDAGAIIDFIWILNNKNAIIQNGNVIGESLLKHNPGVVPAGIYEHMVQVTETGIAREYEQYYSHEQFSDQWFYVAIVKQDDGFIMTTRDITRQKKAEQELFQNRQLLETVLNNTASSIMLLKPITDSSGEIVDFQYTFTNEQTLRSVKRENLRGKCFTDEFPALKDSELLQAYINVMKTGNSFQGDVDITPYGTPIWAQVYARKLGNELLVTYFDITQRKEYEEKLLKLNEDRQTFLLKLSDALAPLSSPAAILSEACRIIGEHLKTDRAFYSEFHDSEGFAYVRSDYNNGCKHSMIGKYIFSDFEWSIPIYRSGHTVIASSISSGSLVPADQLPAMAAIEVEALISIPLIKDDVLISNFSVCQSKVRVWTDYEIELVKQTAERTWAAVERAKTEEALRTSEEKYRTLFNSIDDGYSLLKLIYNDEKHVVDFLHLEVNPAQQRLGGGNNAAGKLVSEIAEIEKYWFKLYEEVAATGKPIRVEYYAKSLDTWFRVHASSVGGAGSDIIAVIFDDITERKRREKQQDYLLRLSDELRSQAGLADIEQKVARLTLNHFEADRCYYCRIEGEKAIITRDASRNNLPSLAGNYPLSSFKIFEEVIKTGGPLVVDDAATSEVLDEPLRQLCLQLGVISFIDVPVIENQRTVGVLCIVQSTPRNWTTSEVDLASEIAERTWAAVERAKAEEALRNNEQTLKQLLKQRDEFIGIASHELKTPVTSIKTYAEIVQERLSIAGHQDDSELLTRLNAQVERLNKLINNLLDTTRIAEGQFLLALEPIDINRLLRQRVDEMKHAANHLFELHLQDSPLVLADSERIGQAVDNILSNAIKYSPEGSTISVITRSEADGIHVIVKDEGYGIPDAALPNIFNKFYRVNINHRQSYPGMGLGLFITYQIIQKHGGSISVTSKEGVGSAFTFVLPYTH